MRRPKSVITDFRPPGAGLKPSLERAARPGAVAWENPSKAKERADHDTAAAALSDWVLLAAARDLGGRGGANQREAEGRWVLGRLAALAREIDRRGLNRRVAQ